MGTLAPSGWRATIRTPPPAMEKAEHGWLNRGSKMYQGLMRGAEVNFGMRQATTDWTQEVTVLEQFLADEAATGSVTCSMVDVDYRGTFSHNKGSDKHRSQKGSNVFYNGRTATLIERVIRRTFEMSKSGLLEEELPTGMEPSRRST
ncbi:hypothetical protein L5515_004062 [Caenorhabditis briggsae]|uniref:Uncharacterized protein n=1 Tax=Caenorhabditis briggsae TaxID=6238 RepID=A0AAE9EJK0_CAEBR|nr:hypothetical protein L5515_004062 [Caenorhabditis briggsae]